ncbi:MAG: hypothetical protein K8T89_25040 [Planctomycetes bacterium]|nr:hypothetical protein [Planctomycetota bacterium]
MTGLQKQILWIVIAIAFGVLRVIGLKSAFLQAMAHLFVGGLIGAWLVDRGRLYLILAIALSVLEVACSMLL